MRLEFEIPEVALQQPSWVYWTLGVIGYLLIGVLVGRWVYRDFAARDAERDGGVYDAKKLDPVNVACGFIFGIAGWPAIVAGVAILLPVCLGSWLITAGNRPKKPTPTPVVEKEVKAWDPAGEEKA